VTYRARPVSDSGGACSDGQASGGSDTSKVQVQVQVCFTSVCGQVQGAGCSESNSDDKRYFKEVTNREVTHHGTIRMTHHGAVKG
jgi:hypothetical protein